MKCLSSLMKEMTHQQTHQTLKRKEMVGLWVILFRDESKLPIHFSFLLLFACKQTLKREKKKNIWEVWSFSSFFFLNSWWPFKRKRLMGHQLRKNEENDKRFLKRQRITTSSDSFLFLFIFLFKEIKEIGIWWLSSSSLYEKSLGSWLQ